jgi:enediyne biosynthesis protein E4
VKYAWTAPGKRPLNILQTIGNGCAFFDYDNDGNLDILLVGPKPALFKGDGKGKFTDVSTELIGGLSGYFLGCTVGDIDNDGFADVYLSGYREGRLLKNQGGKKLTDITSQAGLKPQPWGTACGFADLDADGYLDLVVCNYAHFGPNVEPQLCRFKTQGHGDVLSSCGPKYYKGLPSVVYRNRAGKTFEDSTTPWGFTEQSGRALGVSFAHLANQPRPSVIIANDEARGDFFVPTPTGKWENRGETSGAGYDRDGNVHGGMGVDFGDYNNDQKMDVIVATFRNEVKNLYTNEGGGDFVDRSATTGVSVPLKPYVAFGVKFLDVENDGFLDILVANGHVQDNIEIIEDTTYRQPLQFLQNEHGTRFSERTKEVLQGIGSSIVGRGMATGDFDNDGRVDVLVVDSEGAPLLLHNQTSTSNTWLGVRLVDKKRDAYGATVTARFGTTTLLRQCQSAGSYLSASDPRVLLGLPGATKVTLTIRWPDGKEETRTADTLGRYITVVRE